MLARTMHAIAYDPIHDEIVVPQIFAQGILVFRGGINGEEAPLRYIQGPLTQLQDPDHVEVDPVNNEIFVPQHGHIFVYPRQATGNVAPIRILAGPHTGMGGGDQGVRVDPVHDLLIVSDSAVDGSDTGARILIFNRTDQGDVKPKAIIGGPKSGLDSHGLYPAFSLYPPKGEIIMSVTSRGGESRLADRDTYVGVWSINDNGDVPPRWTIAGPRGAFSAEINGTAIDPKHREVSVADMGQNAVLTFYFPEIF